MTTYLTEPFTGTTGADWSATNWTSDGTGSGGGATIQTNAGRINSGTVGGYAGAARTTRSVNGLSQASIDFSGSITIDANEPYPVIAVRATTSGVDFNNGYQLTLNKSGTLVIQKVVSFTGTNLATQTKTLVAGTTYGFRFQAIGTTIRARTWTGTEPGTWDMSITDSTFTAAGKTGISVGDGSAAVSHSATFDDVLVTDGSNAYAGDATGSFVHTGTTTGLRGVAGVASGTTVHAGTTTGLLGVAAVASGTTVHTGTTTGSMGVSSAASATTAWSTVQAGIFSPAAGAALFSIPLTGTAAGSKPWTGDASGLYLPTVAATTLRNCPTPASAAILWTSTALALASYAGPSQPGALVWATAAAAGLAGPGPALSNITVAAVTVDSLLVSNEALATIDLHGTATVARNAGGSALGPIALTGTSTGLQRPGGVATGVLNLGGVGRATTAQVGPSHGNVVWSAPTTDVATTSARAIETTGTHSVADGVAFLVKAIPALGAVAARLYFTLGAQTMNDQVYGWQLIKLANALVGNLQIIEDLAADQWDDPYRDEYQATYGTVSAGWSQVYDTYRCPDYVLPYLGQFVGVEGTATEDPNALRLRIRDVAGWRRGTLATIEKTGRLFMTGSKTIRVTERLRGLAYRIGVSASRGEVTDVDTFIAGVKAAVPAGIVIEFNLPEGWRWIEFEGFFGGVQTWAGVDSYYAARPDPTWAEVDKRPPGDPDFPNILGLAWLARAGNKLLSDGRRWRFSGANMPWLGLCNNGGLPPHPHVRSDLDMAVTNAQAMGVTLIRSLSLGVSVGSSYSVVTGYDPVNGQFVVNSAAWGPIDYSIYRAGVAGIRLQIPLTDMWRTYLGGKANFVHWAHTKDATITDVSLALDATNGTEKVVEQQFYTNRVVIDIFKAYITMWLNHVNPYTALALKDDPTCAIWELGNDLRDESVAPAWVDEISAHIKSLTPHAMVADGQMCNGISASTSPGLVSSTVDIVGTRMYGTLSLVQLADTASFANGAHKPAIVAEWGWSLDGSGDFLRAIEQNDAVSGDLFYSICPTGETHGTTSYPKDDAALYYPAADVPQANFVTADKAHAATMSTSA